MSYNRVAMSALRKRCIMIERIDFMSSKGILNYWTLALLSTFMLFAGACVLTAQDSKAAAGADSKAVWTDATTGLTWSIKDNGSSISPTQGNQYCRNLRLGGYSDWRLPTIDELEAIYDQKLRKQYKTSGPLELSDPCMLSGSTNNSGEVWTFCFNSGSRNLGGGSGCGTSANALCVRGPAK
jgi:hypothetical protein